MGSKVIEFVCFETRLTSPRITPATSSFPSLPQSSVPYSPSFPNAACIANHHSPNSQRRRTTPTWSCSAENPQKHSHSETRSKQTFWAARQGGNTSSRNTRYPPAISKRAGSKRGRFSGAARSVARCSNPRWPAPLGTGIS